jgi:cytochrome c556
LLVIDGRRVSRSYLPGSTDGDLDSTAIEAKIAANRAAFVAFAHGVHAAGMRVLDAIDARDADALFDRGSELDQACENCHLTFWFPNRPAPAQ